ncbi:hypothetical protein CTI12_AA538190 [Artemisia annua]|uniref:Uncharacterized protein n=1 Tax=Artemisia annua TaxID=35608 RepID=A0A2U1KXU3_ARTAN|nr:hypothetical protein CTI12_AA538190 [Artemisia annua]
MGMTMGIARGIEFLHTGTEHGIFGNDLNIATVLLDDDNRTAKTSSYNIFDIPKGFNVEKAQHKNVIFTVWDVGGQEKLRPLWRHYFNDRNGPNQRPSALTTDSHRNNVGRHHSRKGSGIVVGTTPFFSLPFLLLLLSWATRQKKAEALCTVHGEIEAELTAKANQQKGHYSQHKDQKPGRKKLNNREVTDAFHLFVLVGTM